jgi:hypothetical protein
MRFLGDINICSKFWPSSSQFWSISGQTQSGTNAVLIFSRVPYSCFSMVQMSPALLMLKVSWREETYGLSLHRSVFYHATLVTLSLAPRLVPHTYFIIERVRILYAIELFSHRDEIWIQFRSCFFFPDRACTSKKIREKVVGGQICTRPREKYSDFMSNSPSN